MIHLILLVQKWELIDTPTSKRVFVRFSFSNFEVDIWAGDPVKQEMMGEIFSSLTLHTYLIFYYIMLQVTEIGWKMIKTKIFFVLKKVSWNIFVD